MRATKVVAGFGAAVLAVMSFVILTNRNTAAAHGGMVFPATRTYACYKDGRAGSGGGDLQPTNPACIDAIAKGGKQPLWDWFGNRVGDAGANWKQAAADGKLCGPDAKYDAYNMARDDWPTTNVQSGAQVTLRYNAWAPHPGTWTQWVTRDGFDVTKPLKWSDLEDTPFSTVTNPPINGSGPDGAEYTWPAKLPTKSGRHIIYSVWTRSDSPEVFYNCSDVIFTGGSGTTPTTPTPTVRPTTTASTRPVTTTTMAMPTTTRTTWSTTTVRPTTTAPTTPSTPPVTPPVTGPAFCSASVKVASTWNGGFLAALTVHNAGSTPLKAWHASLGLTAGTAISGNWGGTLSGSTVGNAWWSQPVAAGGTATVYLWLTGPATPAPTVTSCT